MSGDDDNDGTSQGKDFIFRGEDEPTDWAERSGADPASGPPSPPSPPVPPPAPPQPGSLGAPPGAPGAPPPQPPGAPPPPPAAGPDADAPRRKRWPWVVAALVVFCALPLGGCVALIAFGLSEIEEREDTIQSVADDFMDRVVAGRADSTTALMDGGSECLEPTRFAQLLESDLPAADGWETDDVRFVDRDDNSYLANVSEAEEFVYPGREADGFAVVVGRMLSGGSTAADLEILLLKPDDEWLVCTVGVL